MGQKDYIEVKLLGWIILTIIGGTLGFIAGLWLFAKTV
jgi:hypothetical protein